MNGTVQQSKETNKLDLISQSSNQPSDLLTWAFSPGTLPSSQVLVSFQFTRLSLSQGQPVDTYPGWMASTKASRKITMARVEDGSSCHESESRLTRNA